MRKTAIPPRRFQEFVRAADLMPENAVAQTEAAKMLLLAGQYADAKTRAQAAVRLDRRNVDAQILWGTRSPD